MFCLSVCVSEKPLYQRLLPFRKYHILPYFAPPYGVKMKALLSTSEKTVRYKLLYLYLSACLCELSLNGLCLFLADSLLNGLRSLVNESLSREIDRALSTLSEREKQIVEMFFGINHQEMTLEEIGDKFNLTRERVRQIKEKAIRRLRNNSKSKLLKSYLG